MCDAVNMCVSDGCKLPRVDTDTNLCMFHLMTKHIRKERGNTVKWDVPVEAAVNCVCNTILGSACYMPPTTLDPLQLQACTRVSASLTLQLIGHADWRS